MIRYSHLFTIAHHAIPQRCFFFARSLGPHSIYSDCTECSRWISSMYFKSLAKHFRRSQGMFTKSMLLKTSAAAGALLLLALLGLWTGFHSRSSRAGRDHKALTGHVWHWVALLRCSVPFRVRGDHKTWWQGFTRSKPLALRMVQTTHCWHVGRHGIATICCVWWPCHVSSSIHSHWLRHNIGSTWHGPSLDRSGGHLVFHAAYQVLQVPQDCNFQLHKAWHTTAAATKQMCDDMSECFSCWADSSGMHVNMLVSFQATNGRSWV